MDEEDNQTGFVEEENRNNNGNKREVSSASDTLLFKNDEDIMVKETQSDVEPRVSFFGIFSDSKISAIVNLITSAIGGGCLYFPTILSHLGLPITIIIFLFVSACIYYTIDLLRSFVVDTKYFSFALMTNDILGKNWLKLYTICSLIFYLSIEINYLSIIYTLISKMINFSGDNEVTLNIVYFLITIIIEIFICCYISKIRKIHLFSFISFLIFIIVFLTIFIQGIINMAHRPGNKLDYNVLMKPTINNDVEFCLGLMSFIVEFLYGFSYHSSYPTLLNNLKEVDEQNTKIVHNVSYIFISVTYFLITFFGFFLKTPIDVILFISEPEEDISKIKQITFFRIMLCLFLFSVVPLRFIVIRDNYNSLIGKGKTLPLIQDFIIVLICLLFCNIIVYLTNESIINFNIVSNFIQIFGGIFGVIISFVLPVINYIGANGKRKVKSIIGYILAGIFSCIGILSVAYSIYGFAIQNDFDNE
jgi:amino acid permease